jgi:hypothetical protein
MFRCDICGREFKSKSGLTRHKNTCLEIEVITEEEPEEVKRLRKIVSRSKNPYAVIEAERQIELLLG